jgi:lipopolysaccharide export system protein LptA
VKKSKVKKSEVNSQIARERVSAQSAGFTSICRAIVLGCALSLMGSCFAPIAVALAASTTPAKDTTTKDTAKDTKAAPKKKDKEKDPPINVESSQLDYYDKEQKLIYTGEVVAVQGKITLKTPQLVVFLTPKAPDAPTGPPASQSEVLRWEAAGPVTIISKDQIGTGDSGTYEKGEKKFYLNGNVTLTQCDYVTKGDHAVYDLDSGRSVVTGHVRSMFPPKNDKSDKNEDCGKKDSDAGKAEKADESKANKTADVSTGKTTKTTGTPAKPKTQ